MPQQSETCPLEKKKTQWLQCFEIKRHHTEDIAVVNSQLEKHQQVWEKAISHFVTSLFKNMQCSQKSKGILFYFISFPEKRSYSYWVMHFILYLKIADKHWNVCRHLHNMLNTVLCTAMSFVIWTTPFYFYFFWFFTFFFDILPPLENCCETVPSIFLNLSNLLSWGSWTLSLFS